MALPNDKPAFIHSDSVYSKQIEELPVIMPIVNSQPVHEFQEFHEKGGSGGGGGLGGGAFVPQSRLALYRNEFREYAREFLGIMVLVIFGSGGNASTILTASSSVAPAPRGDWTTLSFGWAVGISMGVWISGGGHINPAVTLGFAVWRRFPWHKVPGYIISQLLGAIAGAAIIYGNYANAIDAFEGGTGVRTLKSAGIFGTYALDYVNAASCFFAEFTATAIFFIGILTIIDKKNNVPSGLAPVAIFILVLGIGVSLGAQTGFAINPARDLGPRILTAMAGWGRQVFTFRHQYWIWCPILATILGAQAGAFIYDLFIYTGKDSILSRFFAYRPADNTSRAGEV